MSNHNIGFYVDLTKIIFELSSNIIKYAPYFFCWIGMVISEINTYCMCYRRATDNWWNISDITSRFPIHELHCGLQHDYQEQPHCGTFTLCLDVFRRTLQNC